MAIDTAEKRRCAGGNAPTPDGDIGSYFDRRQIAGNYRGMPMGLSVGGNLSFAGALAKSISLTHMGGSITPTGAVAKSISKYLGGSLTPTGSLVAGAIFPVSVGGELDMVGDLTGGNPDWIEIHPWMNWKGEWAVATEYAIYDVVLYQDGLSIHAFVSKSSHNTGNLPTDAAHWDRLIQEKWRL